MRYIILAFILSVLLLGCSGQEILTGTEPAHKNSQAEEAAALKMAQDIVRNSATYRYDGSKLAHKETKQVDDSSWIFVFTFQSESAGYGDRTGKVAAQMITLHEASVTVQAGKITYAVIDNSWDMINQNYFEY